MKRNRLFPGLALVLVGLIAGIMIASQFNWLPNGHATVSTPAPAVETSPPATPPQTDNDDALIDQLNNLFIRVADKVNPSVVTIFTEKEIKTRQYSPYSSPFFDNPFRDFFGDDFWERFFGPQPPREGRRYVRGMGSGVIVSKDGYILTNNHVIRDADKVTVMLLRGKRLEAKVIGADAKTDIAVLQVEGDDFIPATLGDSDKLRVGEWVVAIGSPLSATLDHTVTAGIVSATGRSNVGLADYEDFIQTDAAINPGNSGGALVNLRGELVGINTAIATETGGFQGIGFAVPINMARAVMDQLIKHGKVIRGWLGVSIQNVTESIKKYFDLPVDYGALIGDVVEDSPADRAGLKSGDVILKIDGKKVKDIDFLRNEVASREPGTEVELLIYRDGKEKTVRVELGELPEEAGRIPQRAERTMDKLGFSVSNLTSELASRYNIDPSKSGVVVTRIQPNSPAYAAGLREGALIKQVNRKKVRNVDDFNRIVSDLKSGDLVLIYAEIRGRNFYAAFEIK